MIFGRPKERPFFYLIGYFLLASIVVKVMRFLATPFQCPVTNLWALRCSYAHTHKRYLNGQLTHEEMLNIIGHQ